METSPGFRGMRGPWFLRGLEVHGKFSKMVVHASNNRKLPWFWESSVDFVLGFGTVFRVNDHEEE